MERSLVKVGHWLRERDGLISRLTTNRIESKNHYLYHILPEQTTARRPILARRRFSVARLGLSGKPHKKMSVSETNNNFFFLFLFKRESNRWPIFLGTQIINTTILNKRIK